MSTVDADGGGRTQPPAAKAAGTTSSGGASSGSGRGKVGALLEFLRVFIADLAARIVAQTIFRDRNDP